MATAVLMPRQGNTVENCVIVDWYKGVGDQVNKGDVLCAVETDKATLEVESNATGTILALFFEEGDEVPVLTPIAAVGEPGDDIRGLGPDSAPASASEPDTMRLVADSGQVASMVQKLNVPPVERAAAISPRAGNLAQIGHVKTTSIQGSGPGGRIIERDILTAMAAQPRLTPVASRMVDNGEYVAPEFGSGIGGRITSKDLIPREVSAKTPAKDISDGAEIQETAIQGIRKVIAERMLYSMQTTAQLTLNTTADAQALLDYRKRLKISAEARGLQDVTIGDLVLYAVSRTLLDYPDLNALFDGRSIYAYKHVHLALAVDSPRGLIAPVISNADTLSLKQISLEAKRLAFACEDGSIAPDELTGGTFTISNLGAMGIEHFSPILNPPQVGILGVGNINLKPVDVEGEVQYIPHLGLSLTINHQVVDGAPGARFLQALAKSLADIDLMLAI